MNAAQVIPFPTDYEPIEHEHVASPESWINEVLRPLRKEELDAEIDLMGGEREAIKRAYHMKLMARYSWIVGFIALLVLVMS